MMSCWSGKGVVLVGVDADGPFAVFLGGGNGAVAGNGADAEDDIGAVVEIVRGECLAAVKVLEGIDIAAKDADGLLLDLVVVEGAVAEADDELVDAVAVDAADQGDGGILGILQDGPGGGEIAGGEGALVHLEGEGPDVVGRSLVVAVHAGEKRAVVLRGDGFDGGRPCGSRCRR